MNTLETLILALERTNERLASRTDFQRYAERYAATIVSNRILIEELRHEINMEGV